MQLCNCGTVQGGGRGNFGTPAARLEPGITIGAAAGLGNSQWRKVRQMQPFRGKGSVELRLYNSDNPESRAVNALRLACQRILVFFNIFCFAYFRDSYIAKVSLDFLLSFEFQ